MIKLFYFFIRNLHLSSHGGSAFQLMEFATDLDLSEYSNTSQVESMTTFPLIYNGSAVVPKVWSRGLRNTMGGAETCIVH